MRSLAKVAAVAALLITPVFAAQAVTLTFDGAACSRTPGGTGPLVQCESNDPINQAYGDGTYVDVSYASSFEALVSDMGFWSGDYSGMQGVAFGDLVAIVTLAARGGGVVRLNSFMIGTFPNADLPAEVTVTDLVGDRVLLNTGTYTQSGSIPSTFTFADASSTVGIRIVFRPDARVGIDNIDFVATPVPELGTGAMLLAGLSMLGLAARNRRRHSPRHSLG